MLKARAEQLNALVVDIRFSPRSRVPHWDGTSLRALLGTRYAWWPEFGNVNYRGGEIKIANPDGGRALMNNLIPCHFDALILLCACEKPGGCHRSVVADLLREDEHSVSELDWSNQGVLLEVEG